MNIEMNINEQRHLWKVNDSTEYESWRIKNGISPTDNKKIWSENYYNFLTKI